MICPCGGVNASSKRGRLQNAVEFGCGHPCKDTRETSNHGLQTIEVGSTECRMAGFKEKPLLRIHGRCLG